MSHDPAPGDTPGTPHTSFKYQGTPDILGDVLGNGMIDPRRVIVPPYHRKPKPWLLDQITASIAAHGYNVAYPIVIEGNTLVEGQHRLLAAIANGITKIPYVAKPQNVSPIRFGLQCNADGQLTAADDVFDLAELCWQLAQDGWKGERIAEELGWNDTSAVTHHKNIKSDLHPLACELARNGTLANSQDQTLANSELAKTNWLLSHFRAFLSELPYRDGDTRATMRAQVAAIRELMAGDKLTAKIAGDVARRYAWHMTLAQWMSGSLAKEVGPSDRKSLLRHIRNNVYGKAHTDHDAKRFGETLAALNERALGIRLYQDDALQRMPQFKDGSIALVVADPPYNTTDNHWDQFDSPEQYIAWMGEWLGIVRPKLADTYHLFLFCDPDYMAPMEMLLRAQEWPIKSRIIWEYRNLVKGRDVTDKFIENYQMCFHCGNHALNWPPEWTDSRFMVQQHATPQSNFSEGKHHPTAKPIDLITHLVNVGSKPGDVVLDPFAGGGTTGAACKAVGQRQCLLIEQSSVYVEVIEQRLGILAVK